jgi:hypothetical protein
MTENPLTWLNPLHLANQPRMPGQSAGGKLAADVVKSGAAWFTVMAGLRMCLLSKNKELDNATRSKVSSEIIPVSPDVKAGDEKREEEAGLQKLAAVNAQTGLDPATTTAVKPVSAGVKAVGTGIGAFTNRDNMIAHMAVLALATYGAGRLGWSLADRWKVDAEDAGIKRNIAKNKDLLDKRVYEEYVRSRGYGNKDKDENKLAIPTDDQGLVLQKAALFKDSHPVDAAVHGGLSAWALYAVVSGLVGFGTGKYFADKWDPNRRRIKALNEYMLNKMRVEGPPQMIDVSDLPRTQGLLTEDQATGGNSSMADNPMRTGVAV